MSSSGNPAIVGALILVPLALLVIVTSAAIKFSDIGRSSWARLKWWRKPTKEGTRHRKHGSDLPIVNGDNIKTWESSAARRSARSSWEDDVENEPEQVVAGSPLG